MMLEHQQLSLQIEDNKRVGLALYNKSNELLEKEFELELLHNSLLKWEKTLARKEKDVQTKINILVNKKLREKSKIYAKENPEKKNDKE